VPRRGWQSEEEGLRDFRAAARSRSLVAAAAAERCGSRVSTGRGRYYGHLRCGSVTSRRVRAGAVDQTLLLTIGITFFVERQRLNSPTYHITLPIALSFFNIIYMFCEW
jgi:hypothetical protein